MLCITSPELIYLITRNLYLLTSFTHFRYPLPLATTNLFPVSMGLIFFFKVPHISEIIQYLSVSSDLLYLVLCPEGPSMLSQMAEFPSFLKKIFIYLAVPGLSCGTWNLHCCMRDLRCGMRDL